MGHLLVVVCCAVFVRLGRWQWDRARSPGGDWQNLGYALQWPLFAAMLALAWARFLWLERHSASDPGPDMGTDTRPEPVRVVPTVMVPTEKRVPPVPRRPADPPIREDDPDDELAAYNAYLARLAEQDRR